MKNLYLRISTGLVAALILSIMPMPEFMGAFRPPWILLMVLYIEFFLPDNFKITALLLIGLFMDVLLSTVIGQHSFALLLVTWVASSKSRRFHFFSMIQQIIFIGFFCLLYQAIISFNDAMMGYNYSVLLPITSALTGMFIWPWIRLLGDSSFATRLLYR